MDREAADGDDLFAGARIVDVGCKVVGGGDVVADALIVDVGSDVVDEAHNAVEEGRNAVA